MPHCWACRVRLGAHADSATGDDAASAGSGGQHAEWHASTERLRLKSSPFASMSTDRCMDAMLDWKHTAGPHYDARVVRSCKPGSLIQSYTWAGDGVDSNGGNLNTGQVFWHEPAGDWDDANISETQKGYGYEADDDYENGTFDIYHEEQFEGAGSPNYRAVPRTCTDRWARVLTLYQDGHYDGCKNFPADDANS